MLPRHRLHRSPCSSSSVLRRSFVAVVLCWRPSWYSFRGFSTTADESLGARHGPRRPRPSVVANSASHHFYRPDRPGAGRRFGRAVNRMTELRGPARFSDMVASASLADARDLLATGAMGTRLGRQAPCLRLASPARTSRWEAPHASTQPDPPAAELRTQRSGLRGSCQVRHLLRRDWSPLLGLRILIRTFGAAIRHSCAC